METATTSEAVLTRYKIDNADVFLEDLGPNKGKITISDTYNHNYSYFWGSMSGTLSEFICRIDKYYFSKNLLGTRSCYKMDVDKTFATLRKYIVNELDLPFYKHMEFQKEMRRVLKDFQGACRERPTAEFFVDKFNWYMVNDMPFMYIDNRSDQESVEKDFKSISECWNFIEETDGDEYIWLQKFHGKLVEQIKKTLTTKQ